MDEHVPRFDEIPLGWEFYDLPHPWLGDRTRFSFWVEYLGDLWTHFMAVARDPVKSDDWFDGTLDYIAHRGGVHETILVPDTAELAEEPPSEVAGDDRWWIDRLRLLNREWIQVAVDPDLSVKFRNGDVALLVTANETTPVPTKGASDV